MDASVAVDSSSQLFIGVCSFGARDESTLAPSMSVRRLDTFVLASKTLVDTASQPKPRARYKQWFFLPSHRTTRASARQRKCRHYSGASDSGSARCASTGAVSCTPTSPRSALSSACSLALPRCSAALGTGAVRASAPAEVPAGLAAPSASRLLLTARLLPAPSRAPLASATAWSRGISPQKAAKSPSVRHGDRGSAAGGAEGGTNGGTAASAGTATCAASTSASNTSRCGCPSQNAEMSAQPVAKNEAAAMSCLQARAQVV